MKYPAPMSTAQRLTPGVVGRFRRGVYRHYAQHGRSLPWRRTRDPYRILVSEIMLQQTQVERVIAKYEQFISAYPDFGSLARAPLRKVLRVWQGLGYNRRALALQKVAQSVSAAYGGTLPDSVEVLRTLPGIGPASAGAICAFAYNRPTLFIETNIRTVFLHVFFRGKEAVRDKDIIPLVEKTLDTRNPRRWYYALMDYGVMLKKAVLNPNRRSAHYQRQTRFEGSDREIRGLILRNLIESPSLPEEQLVEAVGRNPERVRNIIAQLASEGFLLGNRNRLRIMS
jgi:A/G-specific adenine glycosylase